MEDVIDNNLSDKKTLVEFWIIFARCYNQFLPDLEKSCCTWTEEGLSVLSLKGMNDALNALSGVVILRLKRAGRDKVYSQAHERTTIYSIKTVNLIIYHSAKRIVS